MSKDKWLQVRIDKDRKEKLKKAADSSGMTMSDLINSFIDNLE